MRAIFCAWLLVASGVVFCVRAAQENPAVTTPPDSFFELVNLRDREAAKSFYTKYLDVQGMPVVGSKEVADEALRRTRWIVLHLLAGRPDVVEAMKKNRMYLIVIGRDQLYCDMPEYSHAQNAAYLNERVRGTGGRPTSFGEENVLSLPLDRYDDESIAVHEFCHTIDGALRSIDPTWTERRNKIFRDALEKRLWKNTYAGSNPGEFWAEICQSYFDCNRINNWNHGAIGTREQLKEYDPESYELVRDTFKLEGDKDWKYTWAQKLPNVTAPPAKFKIDPYYTKFTWAREFTVVGRDASDAELLRANNVIRKMLAYRHDILKALIADGWRLAVTKRGEKIPEDAKMLRVDAGSDADVIRIFAKTFYDVTAHRAVDPNWDKRRDVQQYEMRVKRLDEDFGKRVAELHDKAKASNSAADYWADGVVKYFGRQREELEKSDSDFFALVKETMAYEGHPDWRFEP
ncbi:MAG TPA: hypothetical protein VI282_06055 [Verrucomicrobiae bacterium]